MRGLALDLAGRTGYCLGELGKVVSPKADTFTDERDGIIEAVERFSDFLVRIYASPERRPDVVAVERALPANAFRGGNANEMALQLSGCLIGITRAYRIPLYRPTNGQWMKAFTGKGKWGSRSENKAAALRTAKMLRYCEPFETDTDKADAAGIFHWLSGHCQQIELDSFVRKQVPF